jgi:hypothetical protein
VPSGVGEYGVGIGTFVRFTRDDPDDFGSFFHGHIDLRVPNGSGGFATFTSAIDVNKPDGGVGYFHPSNLDVSDFTTVTALGDGYHELAKTPVSGALDYHRNPLISVPPDYLAEPLPSPADQQMVWTENVGTAALEELEGMFTGKEASIQKVYVFGAAFNHPMGTPPTGVHDVHCNQGDPPGPFQHLDGIWQDGGVIVRYLNNRLEGFFVKFTTQTLDTDEQGLPV